MKLLLAGADAQDKRAEAVYLELRERSQTVVGSPARPRRIFKLGCRLDGHDREIEVGRPLPPGSDLVTAIFDHGREEAFVVHTAAEGARGELRIGGPVYSVTEFS